jgi:pimeloyl-ACP methyl ester carboxylesterase
MIALRASILFLALALASSPAEAFVVDFGPGFQTRQILADGALVSITSGGHGPVVVLLHGYAEDSRMWKPLAERLKSTFTVVAPDLPGIGNSSIPSNGLDMVTAAKRVRDAVHSLGYNKVMVVGHDIGLMVAYAYAATYPREVTRLALMDAFLPGVDGWEPIYNASTFWHFRFYGPTPLKLVAGREDIYFTYFWDSFAADPARSLSSVDRRNYVEAYSRPGRMAAGWAYFASFPKTAIAFAQLAQAKLAIPVLSIGGEKSLGAALGAQARLVSDHATVVVVPDAGHWLMEEQPQQTMTALTHFLQAP